MTSLVDTWIKHEKNREIVMKELEKNPLTRHELARNLGFTDNVVANLIRSLTKFGYITTIEGDPCSVTRRIMGRYTIGPVKFVPKDWTVRKERHDYNKAIKERQEQQKKIDQDSRRIVIKVNEHSTIYMNSRRPNSDFTIKKDTKNRKKSRVAMGSGMTMFDSW
jgi:DNA-binding Lrp family transcriptional regulator